MLNYGQRKHLWLAATLSNCLLKGTTTAPLCIELSKDSWCKWVTQPAQAQVLIVIFLHLLHINSLKSAHPFLCILQVESQFGADRSRTRLTAASSLITEARWLWPMRTHLIPINRSSLSRWMRANGLIASTPSLVSSYFCFHRCMCLWSTFSHCFDKCCCYSCILVTPSLLLTIVHHIYSFLQARWPATPSSTCSDWEKSRPAARAGTDPWKSWKSRALRCCGILLTTLYPGNFLRAVIVFSFVAANGA